MQRAIISPAWLPRTEAVPRRIGEPGPAAERHAVLDLLARPGIGDRDEFWIVGEDAREIDAVVAAVALDHGGSLDVAQDFRIDFRRIEATPVDRLESPVAHRCQPLWRPNLTSNGDSSVTVIKRASRRLAMACACRSGQFISRRV
jgi:hypothetical protein